jgi:hypothetical protein
VGRPERNGRGTLGLERHRLLSLEVYLGPDRRVDRQNACRASRQQVLQLLNLCLRGGIGTERHDGVRLGPDHGSDEGSGSSEQRDDLTIHNQRFEEFALLGQIGLQIVERHVLNGALAED